MKFRYTILILLMLTAGLTRNYAQDVNSLYFMKGVPQNYQINPAFQPSCNFFLGLPGLAPLNVQVSNPSFGLGDVLQYSSELDSLVLFLHPDGIGGEEFLSRLKDQNFFSMDFSSSLASFGMRNEDTYFTFDIRERVNWRMDYSKDYLRLPIVGPDSGQFFDINLGMDLAMMNELSMGISQKLTDRLTVGIRGKLLFGQANVTTEKFDMTLSTNEEIWRAHNDISINTSAPYLIDYINFAVNAPIDVITGDLDDFDAPTLRIGDIFQDWINPRNFGLALDIGADFRMNDWLQLSASIVDFGSIKWKDDMINWQNQTDYDYEGVEVYISDEEDFVEVFLDSLQATYDEFTVTAAEYRNYLPTKLYLGGAFYPHEKISLGLLSRTEFFRGNVNQQFTASANFHPLRVFSASLSYSIINNTYKNLGLGIALNIFPFNLYILSDTGPSVNFFPADARYFNYKMGLNIVIGCDREKKYDRPLID